MVKEIKNEIKEQVKSVFETKDEETIVELEKCEVNNTDIA